MHHDDGHYCGVIVTAFNINTMGKWTLSEYLKLKKKMLGGKHNVHQRIHVFPK